MTYNTQKFVFAILFLLTSSLSFAEETISISEMIDKIMETKEESFSLQNTTVKFKKGVDDVSKYYDKENRGFSFVTNKEVSLNNCSLTASFYDCTFSFINMTNCNEDANLKFKECTFTGDFSFYGENVLENLRIEKSTFNRGLILHQKINRLYISECTFSYDNSLDEEYGMAGTMGFVEHGYQIHIASDNSNLIEITDCTFEQKNNDVYSLVLQGGTADHVRLVNNKFVELAFYDFDSERSFDMTGSSVSGNLSIVYCNFPTFHTNIDWSIIKGNKLSVLDGFHLRYNKTLNANSKTLGKDDKSDLIALYSQIQTIYTSRGDDAALKGCQAELKAFKEKK